MTLSRRQAYLLMAAPFLLYVALLGYALFADARASFTTSPDYLSAGGKPSTMQYRQALTNGTLRATWLTTLELSVTVAVIATVGAMAISYTLWRIGGRTRTVMTVIIVAPMLVSGVVRAYAWLGVLGRNGLLWNTSKSLGMSPVSIQYDRTAVTIGLVHVLLPYAVLLILGSLDSIKLVTLRAAASLGAGPVTTFVRVVLPGARAGLLAAFLVVFSLAAASYSVPLILGGGRVYTIARSIYQSATATNNLPRSAALSILLIIVCVAATALAQRFGRTRRRDKSDAPAVHDGARIGGV